MSEVDIIKRPIKEEMSKFEAYFRNSIKSKVPLLGIITNYIFRTKGKQMRPMLVFLSAKLHGEINEKTFVAASLIELLHTATLVHDDVVDESHMRRGLFSVNALWNNKVAVLVGDFFLSKGLLISVENNAFNLLRIVSEAVKEMSEGELLQIEKARKLDIIEEIYFEIIRKKTASLIASCSASGAESVGVNSEIVAKMKLFGEYLGIAFQIKDDILDYQATGLTGKPSGNDLREKKITLPLIYALKQVSLIEKRRIINIIKKHNNNTAKIKEVVQFVKDKGGIEHSEQVMQDYKNKCIEILNYFPDNEAKESLKLFVEYSISRKK